MIDSTGTITAQNGALFDVSGDSAGTVDLIADGSVSLLGGSASEVVRGSGLSDFVDEGERGTDGGVLQIVSGGTITLSGPVALRGQNQAAGGSVLLDAILQHRRQPTDRRQRRGRRRR